MDALSPTFPADVDLSQILQWLAADATDARARKLTTISGMYAKPTWHDEATHSERNCISSWPKI
jgi:hypothetical protein